MRIRRRAGGRRHNFFLELRRTPGRGPPQAGLVPGPAGCRTAEEPGEPAPGRGLAGDGRGRAAGFCLGLGGHVEEERRVASRLNPPPLWGGPGGAASGIPGTSQGNETTGTTPPGHPNRSLIANREVTDSARACLGLAVGPTGQGDAPNFLRFFGARRRPFPMAMADDTPSAPWPCFAVVPDREPPGKPRGETRDIMPWKEARARCP
jgi:hypothetical protein